MGGLSIGVFWGTLVSAVGLAALSLSSPLPPRGDDTGQVGAADAPVAVVEETATAPESEEAEAVAPAAESEVAPETLAEEAPEAEPEAAPEVVPEAAPEPAPEPTPQVAPTQESAPATEVPLPSGSEFNRPPPEPEAALPAPDAAPASTAPQAPALASNGAAPSLDTAPAAQPAVDAVAPAAITAEATDAVAPASPAAAPAPSVASGPAALSEPAASETPQVSTALLPQVAEDAPEPDAEPDALARPSLPTVGEAAQIAPADPAQPEEEASQEVAASTLPSVPGASGLPRVAPLIAPLEPEVEAEAEAEIEEEIAELPAIQAFATPFDEAETRPLMAVVLIDEPGSPIDLETLTRFSFPVAFAVDPLHPEAAARAAAYRAAGFEVVVLGAMIAEGATAVDTEVALAAAMQTLPEAVAVIDTPESRIQGDRPVLDATVGALAESGHGLLAFPRGLNAAEQTASRAGVPGATVFRFLDGEDQRATVITRFLSRAAFAAAQEGTVIVVGRTRPDTVTALFSWALGGRTEAVALAPLSATMLRAAE